MFQKLLPALCLLSLMACVPPAGSPAPADSPSPEPPVPTLAVTPTETPRPSPTVPAGGDFACLPPDGERVSGIVAGVVDGDTITVQVGIQKWTVRYIGVDTPETNVVPAERLGLEAKGRNRELVSGERVTLVSDPQAGNTDIYDRLLRYVIAGDVFVNVQLVREGLARYYASEMACGAAIFAAEEEARAADVGLWGPTATPEP